MQAAATFAGTAVTASVNNHHSPNQTKAREALEVSLNFAGFVFLAASEA